MAERSYALSGIILKSRDYKDTDKIVTFFTQEQGKLTALAKGARKPVSSLRAAVQPFVEANLALAKSRGNLDIITQGQVISGRPGILAELPRIHYAAYLAELAQAALPEKKPQPAVYPLLLTAFSLVELAEDLPLAARFFELRLLRELGLMPDLSACHLCGRRAEQGQFLLSPPRGGLICESCAGGRAEAGLSPGALKTMQWLLTCELRQLPRFKIGALMHHQIAAALTDYLNYYLDYDLQSRAFLELE